MMYHEHLIFDLSKVTCITQIDDSDNWKFSYKIYLQNTQPIIVEFPKMAYTRYHNRYKSEYVFEGTGLSLASSDNLSELLKQADLIHAKDFFDRYHQLIDQFTKQQ